ncbi:MAG: CRTAC1 family protein [Gammaproteobacteria bacterium]
MPRAEDRIGRAFRTSLLVFAAIAVAITLALYLGRDTDDVPRGADAEIAAPVIMATPTKPGGGSASSTGERGQEGAPLPPRIPFTDITARAGIDFVHTTGAYGDKLIPETMGSGLAFLDYDADGDPDLYLVSSNHWPDKETDTARRRAASARLYRNDSGEDGGVRYVDVTEAIGLLDDAYGMGATVADYDADGDPDIYLTVLGRNRLYRNDGDRFTDVARDVGVAGNPDEWSSGAVFLDADGDGDLDLFVGNYVRWSRAIDLEIDFRLTGLGRAYGAPNHYTGAFDRLYRNDGPDADGVVRFTDISEASGIRVADPISGRPEGKALGVTATDLDDDGHMDILVANDTTRNFLFRNLGPDPATGDARFEEIGELEGMAYSNEGQATSGMGIDAARYRNDGETAVAVGNFGNEMSSLFVTAGGRGPLADEALLEGLGAPSRLALTFAVLFLDADLDGRLDLLQANGHLEQEINSIQPSQTYAQSAQLFWNCGEACARRLTLLEQVGDLSVPMVARGAAYADIDGDGDLDLAFLQNGRRAVLLRNDQDTGHHWLRVRLRGRGANRDAIGARVTLRGRRGEQTRELMPARGYLSSVEPVLSFGLGADATVPELEIRWPDGTRQNRVPAGIDRELLLEQRP